MKLQRMKMMVAGGWVLAACGVAFAAGVTSAAGWATLVGLGVLPPIVLWRTWNTPEPTMSESIADARR